MDKKRAGDGKNVPQSANVSNNIDAKKESADFNESEQQLFHQKLIAGELELKIKGAQDEVMDAMSTVEGKYRQMAEWMIQDIEMQHQEQQDLMSRFKDKTVSKVRKFITQIGSQLQQAKLFNLEALKEHLTKLESGQNKLSKSLMNQMTNQMQTLDKKDFSSQVLIEQDINVVKKRQQLKDYILKHKELKKALNSVPQEAHPSTIEIWKELEPLSIESMLQNVNLDDWKLTSKDLEFAKQSDQNGEFYGLRRKGKDAQKFGIGRYIYTDGGMFEGIVEKEKESLFGRILSDKNAYVIGNFNKIGDIQDQAKQGK